MQILKSFFDNFFHVYFSPNRKIISTALSLDCFSRNLPYTHLCKLSLMWLEGNRSHPTFRGRKTGCVENIDETLSELNSKLSTSLRVRLSHEKLPMQQNRSSTRTNQQNQKRCDPAVDGSMVESSLEFTLLKKF